MLELGKTYQTSENRYVTMVNEKRFFVDHHGEFWSEDGHFHDVVEGNENVDLKREPITVANAREIIKNLQEKVSDHVYVDNAEVLEYLDAFLALTEPPVQKAQLVLEDFKRYKTFGGQTVRVEKSGNRSDTFFGYLPSNPKEFVWSSHGIYLEDMSQQKWNKALPLNYYDLVSEA